MQGQDQKVKRFKKDARQLSRKSITGKEKHSLQAKKAMSDFATYLKSHNIFFKTDCFEETPLITMLFKNCEACPHKISEGCIYFYEDVMEVRVYYSELGSEICKKSDNLPDLYRLLNYLHAQVWPQVQDGVEGALYKSQYLFYPRFYVTEDSMYDITATMLVPYTHFEMDELETEDFITAALPNLMNSLSVPIFLLLAGEISAKQAISMVKSEVLGGGDGRWNIIRTKPYK